jgi:hypothetical protein
MEIEDFIYERAEGDSNDAEIYGLTEALRLAESLLEPADLVNFERKLPGLLRKARTARF